ncbi:MAG TPA: YdcF family protein [Reyranella sp.]|nr:YdcF family protein [Reyranella sp.]
MWDYMRFIHPPAKADVILVLGSFDVNAAIHAARLWHADWAPKVVMSGGIAHRGGMLDTGWDRPEAEVFATTAVKEGVPREAILLEARAQNTSENFTLGRFVMEQAGLRPSRLIVVAKPYMTRRGFATGRKVWPEAELLMQCEPIGMVDYFSREADPERTLQAMVGDLHRIVVYPGLGFQVEQEVPPAVVGALRALVAAGYGERLVPGHGINAGQAA